jgi:hypothetical protein
VKAKVVVGREQEDGFSATLYQPQVQRVLKTLELISAFNEFKEGVVSMLEQSKLEETEIDEYKAEYEKWRQLSLLSAAEQQSGGMEEITSRMRAFEDKTTEMRLIELRE